MGFLTLFLSEHKGIPETLAAPPFFPPWITTALVRENLPCWADLPTSCTSDGWNVGGTTRQLHASQQHRLNEEEEGVSECCQCLDSHIKDETQTVK